MTHCSQEKERTISFVEGAKIKRTIYRYVSVLPDDSIDNINWLKEVINRTHIGKTGI